MWLWSTASPRVNPAENERVVVSVSVLAHGGVSAIQISPPVSPPLPASLSLSSSSRPSVPMVRPMSTILISLARSFFLQIDRPTTAVAVPPHPTRTCRKQTIGFVETHLLGCP